MLDVCVNMLYAELLRDAKVLSFRSDYARVVVVVLYVRM